MAESRSVLVFFVALILSVSFAVPIEDVREVSCDESESLPRESSPLFSVTVSEALSQRPVVQIRVPLLGLDSRRVVPQHPDGQTGSPFISDSLTILSRSLRG